ncbi:DNA double-strand break repair nuclease NurA [Nanoarchaeota archaeon]
MQEIIDSLKTIIPSNQEDEICFNNICIPIKKENFEEIKSVENKTIAFIDGGQAQLLAAPNFSLDIIRIYAIIFKDKNKINKIQKQFYLLTKTNEHLEYQSQIFGDKIIDEKDLKINSLDPTIKQGTQRASVNTMANIARRFAELSLCKEISKNVDFVVLDGNLEVTTTNENKYLKTLPPNVAALAKTSSLFSKKGNNIAGLLNEISPKTTWLYFAGEENQRKIYFVKLNQHSDYVFRFEGNIDSLGALIQHCQDPVFPGYPYGLIYADKFARISNQEKEFLRTQFITKLGKDFERLKKYLNAKSAHDVLDNIG